MPCVLQGTPEPQSEVEEKTPAVAVDKDGKPLPGAVDKDGKPLPGAADANNLKIATSPKSKKAEPAYIPRGPLKSKYHIQVCFDNALSPASILQYHCLQTSAPACYPFNWAAAKSDSVS